MFGLNHLKIIYLKIMRPTYDLQVSQFVPSDQYDFVSERVFQVRWFLKYVKRLVVFFLSAQSFRVWTSRGCLRDAQRILWINLAAPSLGDSLMDLSARVMLREYDVDLLTAEKNEDLYRADDIFSKTTTNPRVARRWHQVQPYQVIIVDSFAPRVLWHKLRVSIGLPLVGLYGFVNGFEVHRTYFAFRRLEYLLGATGGQPIKTHLTIPPDLVGAHDKQNGICIAVGGEWDFRTYDRWADVIDGLINTFPIVLVGSENGLVDAEEISRRFPQVRSFVGRLSLLETAACIARGQFFIGADGGLWHIACSLGVPNLVLFADCALYDELGQLHDRSTSDTKALSLYAETKVSEISPEQIVKSCLAGINARSQVLGA